VVGDRLLPALCRQRRGVRWAREDIERQDLLDLADAQGYELSPERAARAVAAGRGSALRERDRRGAPPVGLSVASGDLLD
jgi:hypothetical protein